MLSIIRNIVSNLKTNKEIAKIEEEKIAYVTKLNNNREEFNKRLSECKTYEDKKKLFDEYIEKVLKS